MEGFGFESYRIDIGRLRRRKDLDTRPALARKERPLSALIS